MKSAGNVGEEALKIFQRKKPDLALLDVVLPGIDGIEVLRQAKKVTPADRADDERLSHGGSRRGAMKLGAYDYLIKPFHIADMLNTIRRASEMLTLHVRVRDSVEPHKGRYDFGRSRHPESRLSRDAGDGPPGRRKRPHHRPDPGRERHGKRGAGQGDPLRQPARARPAGGAQLRRPARHAAGERTIRLRTGRLYRRPPPQGRPDRKSSTAGHCFSTKSATCRPAVQAKLLRVLEDRAASCGSVEPSRSTSMSASSPPPTRC